jgi:DNA polymerase V
MFEITRHAAALGLLRASDVQPGGLALFALEGVTTAAVPFVVSSAQCGFPSPADDYLDRPLDFNQLLIDNAPATFAVRVAGDSMIGIGIFPGDIAVVNRAHRVVDRCIVIALVDGEFTLKRYRKRGSRLWLQAENPAFADIEITEETSFEVWGVITKSIRML